MAATATGITIDFFPASALRCSNLRFNISSGLSIIFPASGSPCRSLRIQASKSGIDEPDIIFQGYIDDAKYLAKLGAGSVLGAAAIKYGSALFPQITTPSITQALVMISSPVVIAVLLLIKKSSVGKKQTETISAIEEEEVTIMGIEKELVSAGTGPKPVRGQNVTVHCTGFGKNGDLSTKFWSTKDPGEKPFTFKIGQGSVIKGWDEGVMGMRVGEVARLKCSPDYAYGSSGFPAWGIHPNSTLIFEIEVLKAE